MLMTRDERTAPGRVHVVAGDAADVDAVTQSSDPSHAFLRGAWFDSAAPGEVENLLAVRGDGTPLAALPLIRRRAGPFRIAEVPGSYWPFRSLPLSRLTGDDELVAFLRSPELRRHCGPAWRLGPVYADDSTAQRLGRCAAAGGWTMLTRRLGTCYDIDVAGLLQEGPWPRPVTLRRLRTKENRLAKLGEVEFRSFTGANWSADDRDAIAAAEAGSWVAEQGGALQFHHGAQRVLWERVAQDPVLAPMLFGSLLRIGGVPAAYTFGLEVGPVRYHIANGYDQHFADHGVGRILLYRDFADAARRGIQRISWGSGDAGYKGEMGAKPGPAILDLLFVRSPLLALPLRLLWRDKKAG